MQEERPGPSHGPQQHLQPRQQRPRRRGPAARVRDAARRAAWLQEKQQQCEAEPTSSEKDTVICSDTETVSASIAASNTMLVENNEAETMDSDSSDVIPQLDGPAEATISLILDKEDDEEESVEEEAEPVIFKMEDNGWPEVKLIAPGVKPPDRVLHPELGMGDLPKKTERYGITWWEYNFWRCGVGNIQRDMYQVH